MQHSAKGKSWLEVMKTGFSRQLQEEISGYPRGRRGERDVGYSVSLLPIAFLITASLVLHSSSNPLHLLVLEFKEKDNNVSLFRMYIQGFGG